MSYSMLAALGGGIYAVVTVALQVSELAYACGAVVYAVGVALSRPISYDMEG